ncbi:pyridoxal phosphate-dependent aminotransferase [Desulforhabdus amnigena]|uniref:Aminotransferase n=1 Tax=Desulforhabdus amnigena TaxID=40218 RepID=A0A9W6FTJ4_9BACT|nr:threonine-phosphate decarboxylase [Desulforhabdus amnigena]GLI34055.1 threonine-phosphate decarboxylase [Desulforhabdus amnigena]
MAIVHGGNVYEIAARLGCSPDSLLDYSASINPLGPPPGLMEEFTTCFHRLQHYPDIANRSLIEALSRFHGLPENRIVVGNGSTELIYWLPRALEMRKGGVVLPTFGEYRKAFELQGVEMQRVVTVPDTHFQPTVEQLDTLCDKVSPEAILFTHPGSPSGTLLSPAVREWIREKSRPGGIVCIVDEVFVDFCEEESLKRTLTESCKLVLIRSMTKFYGIPGLRLGYLLTSDDIAARMRHFLPPWSVNTLAQIAGAFCLGQDAYRRETLKLVEHERTEFARQLEKLDGLKVYPGRANYLLVELGRKLPPAAVLQEELLHSRGILIRDCSSFEGLNEHFIRLAVRLPEQNRRVLDGITDWVRSHSS